MSQCLSRRVTPHPLLRRLFNDMRHEAIPLALGVPFLLKIQGVGLTDVAAQAGLTRADADRLLSGENPPTPAFRDALKAHLGFDPMPT